MCNKKSESVFEKHLKEASLLGCNSFILGNFNIDLNEKCSKTKKLKNIFENYGFTELINAPTRKDPVSGRESALDQIWTNSNKKTIAGKVLGVSDHDGIYVKFSMEKEKPKIEKITIRNFNNYKEESFIENLKEQLEKSNINKLIDEKLANEATEELTKIIKTNLDKHAPLIQVLPKEKKDYIPWYNDELRTKIKIKKELLRDSRTFGKKLFDNRLKKNHKCNYILKKNSKTKIYFTRTGKSRR